MGRAWSLTVWEPSPEDPSEKGVTFVGGEGPWQSEAIYVEPPYTWYYQIRSAHQIYYEAAIFKRIRNMADSIHDPTEIRRHMMNHS